VKGDTSSFECAHQLGKLCENRHLVVNLIPYNSTDVKDKLQCPSNEHMQEFRDIVASYGTFCTIRRTMGADIASACGQLVQKKQTDAEGRPKGAVDIEDVIGNRTNKQKKEQVPGSAKVAATESANDARSIPEAPALWIKLISNEDLDRLTNILTVAATVSASCFLVSSLLCCRKRC
jgi:transcriptional regulator of nitric oxide reductase